MGQARSGSTQFQQALQIARRRAPDWYTEDDIAEAAHELVDDWRREEAAERAAFGDPEDTPGIEAGVHNCDDAGTGEGRWHGRM